MSENDRYRLMCGDERELFTMKLTHAERSRAAYAKLVSQGWTGALRQRYPDERIYSFWHYWRDSWQRNAGLRIDHLLLSPVLAKRLEDAGVDRAVRGRAEPSDHAPVWITLRDKARR